MLDYISSTVFLHHCIHQHQEMRNKHKFREDQDNDSWMLNVEIPLWDEEDDSWMLEVEEDYLLNNAMESYDVV